MTARDGGNAGNAGAVSGETARDGGNAGNAGAVSGETARDGGNGRTTGTASDITADSVTVTDQASARPRIALIWAMARNRVIGHDNRLPWRLPADLAHFKRLTSGHPVIMGRKTFESLGRPLPQRTNIVVTRDPSYAPSGCLVAHGVSESLRLAFQHAPAGSPQVFVIGGAELYRQMLPLADRLYITQVETDANGDTWFPSFDAGHWNETARHHHPADDRNTLACTFLTLERKTPRSG